MPRPVIYCHGKLVPMWLRDGVWMCGGCRKQIPWYVPNAEYL